MDIRDPQVLRSIVSEAGRQHQFYIRRGDEELAQAWAEIESIAFHAKALARTLSIHFDGQDTKEKGGTEVPPPIMGCGPQQQLRKPFIPKVL